MRAFQLSSSPLQTLPLTEGLSSPQAGALVTFEGWVRNHNEGKSVVALEYEAFDRLCDKEGARILEEAKAKFAVMDVRCVHRTGRLNVGEMAVWVGVTAVHREDAFKACSFIIDTVKVQLPIWKKEFYDNGDSGWVACEHCLTAAGKE